MASDFNTDISGWITARTGTFQVINADASDTAKTVLVESVAGSALGTAGALDFTVPSGLQDIDVNIVGGYSVYLNDQPLGVLKDGAIIRTPDLKKDDVIIADWTRDGDYGAGRHYVCDTWGTSEKSIYVVKPADSNCDVPYITFTAPTPTAGDHYTFSDGEYRLYTASKVEMPAGSNFSSVKITLNGVESNNILLYSDTTLYVPTGATMELVTATTGKVLRATTSDSLSRPVTTDFGTVKTNGSSSFGTYEVPAKDTEIKLVDAVTELWVSLTSDTSDSSNFAAVTPSTPLDDVRFCKGDNETNPLPMDPSCTPTTTVTPLNPQDHTNGFESGHKYQVVVTNFKVDSAHSFYALTNDGVKLQTWNDYMDGWQSIDPQITLQNDGNYTITMTIIPPAN